MVASSLPATQLETDPLAVVVVITYLFVKYLLREEEEEMKLVEVAFS